VKQEKLDPRGCAFRNVGAIREDTRHMKRKPLASPPSGTQDMQADAFFSSFFAPKSNPYYRNHLHLYPARAVIVKQGTPAHAVYLIEHGLVKLVRETLKGNKVIMGLRHRDWLIGAPTVLLNRPYNYTSIAVVPTLLRSIPKEDFLKQIKKNEQFSMHVHRLLSQQIFDQMKRIEAMKCLSAENRLVRFMAETAREMEPLGSDKPDGFALPFSNQELAQLLMITPEHLCRVLKKTEQKGIIRRAKGALVVTNPAGLFQEATR
jgi:CRP-like cAMP-binding protein